MPARYGSKSRQKTDLRSFQLAPSDPLGSWFNVRNRTRLQGKRQFSIPRASSHTPGIRKREGDTLLLAVEEDRDEKGTDCYLRPGNLENATGIFGLLLSLEHPRTQEGRGQHRERDRLLLTPNASRECNRVLRAGCCHSRRRQRGATVKGTHCYSRWKEDRDEKGTDCLPSRRRQNRERDRLLLTPGESRECDRDLQTAAIARASAATRRDCCG